LNNKIITRRQLICGWIAVAIIAVIASLWAYWGGIENFYEGWYSKNIWENLLMMLIQYWMFAIVFMVIGFVGIRFPKVSLFLNIALGIGAAIFFAGASFSVLWVMIIIPLVAIGLLFFFGVAKPKKLAYMLVVGIPVLILAVTSIFGMVRIGARLDDEDYGARMVEGNEGICLIWAPKGPGWPESGVSYEEAKELCAHLNEDGTELVEEEVNIWRLPTVEEAVASQILHGENAGGVWNEDKKLAEYELKPDKETPLWDPHSMVIYYWTGTIAEEGRAYVISYNGGAYPRDIEAHYGYLAFRAVKECMD